MRVHALDPDLSRSHQPNALHPHARLAGLRGLRGLMVSEFAAPLPTVVPEHQKAETDERAQLSVKVLTDMQRSRIGCCFPSLEEHV